MSRTKEGFFFNIAAVALFIPMSVQAMPSATHKLSNGTCQDARSLGDYDMSVLANLNFHSPGDEHVSRKLKSLLTYPQGFFIDENSGELLVLRYSNTKPAQAIVEIYGWPDFKYKKLFYLEGTHGTVSENLVVLEEQGVKYIFVRGGNGLIKYPISANQKDGDALEGEKMRAQNLAQSFSYFENKWYLEEARSQWMYLGFTRGDYTVYDDQFLKIGSISFDPFIAGFKGSQSLEIQKHQGFTRYKHGFAMSFGGFWKYGTRINPYHRQGVELFDAVGNCIESYVVDPRVLVDALRRKGIVADRIENEGIQVLHNGEIVLMNVAQIFRTQPGGLLFLKLNRPGERSKNYLLLNSSSN